ncbi:MAG TPA: bifunctional phosphopantothenoylcysteine decarboxylase/phosphopantothenate--cysteine ligase CoaBC [Chitinophagaceae bacterium]|nr:bifunctional phosphopantothenoylcysteine decarboxylase/phosphopantothenate--cysteine ligase CoaBC [Chitinophagaceae bacterium]
MLEGKKILIGVTGSIAAYKSVYLVRLLVKRGAEVKVIITPVARDFVSPLTLSTLTRNPVLCELAEGDSWANHVMLGRWADLFLVAPLSCNTLAKMAGGQCDNLLLATYFSATCPVLLVPAMDEDMWRHPATRQNVQRISAIGQTVLPVATGDLASGLFGEGRMAEPEEILAYIEQNFFLTRPLEGKKALVTAGPTFEPIDPVRFIGNHSSGKMGIAIAKELQARGAEVQLILGPVSSGVSVNGMPVTRVNTAEEMLKACENVFSNADITVMAAAVADYAVENPGKQKVKKEENRRLLQLVRTKDILHRLGSKKKNKQVLVGFALETDDERTNALKKLREKNADLIVLNSLADEGAGFGVDTNRITIFGSDGEELRFETKPKAEVARDIVNVIIRKYYA